MRRLACAVAVAAATLGCSGHDAASPFLLSDGGAPSVDASAERAVGDAAEDAGPEASGGAPCLDDAQCDDGVACTLDACDAAVARCRNVPDHAACANARFCDGEERCVSGLGCRPGVPVACTDGDTCTVDACDEATHGCTHLPRDADGDGDPDAHCAGGHDCDDLDPTASSLHAEVCGNGRDDDCDAAIDETPCSPPAHDGCGDPLVISGSGSYVMSTAGARLDGSASCVSSTAQARDVVASIVVAGVEAVDVDVVAEFGAGRVTLAVLDACADPSSERACDASQPGPAGTNVARVRARSLSPGTHTLRVLTEGAGNVTLRVAYEAPSAPPTNETCGTAAPLVPGTAVDAEIVDAARDLATACSASTGELVWSFDLAAVADVRVYATSTDGVGWPSVSLRDAGCALASDEIACGVDAAVELFARALPAGRYAVSVAATAPTHVELLVVTSPPTVAAADESCAGAPALAPGVETPVALSTHTDDVNLACLTGAVDAAYALDLAEPSDVLLVERIASGDQGAVELSLPACRGPVDRLVCGAGGLSPVRASRRGVPAGAYRVVVESSRGNDATLTAWVRPAEVPALVAFADGCADALAIGPSGGLYQGDTGRALADWPGACDVGGGAPLGAPDQMLSLVLDHTARVLFDMSGSSYVTLLELRLGDTCPGTPVAGACSLGFGEGASFLDRVLAPGTYWVQIDGYAGRSGAWSLDVRVVDP